MTYTQNYFSGINTIEALKKAYRKLCQLNHPDNGGNVNIMASINKQYKELFNKLKNSHNIKAEADETGKTRPINECPEEFINVINELLKFKGLTVELCGSWIWISGDTKTYKNELKAIGCKWASKKKMWYWRSEADACKGNRHAYSMFDIRLKYGSEAYRTNDMEFIPAVKSV